MHHTRWVQWHEMQLYKIISLEATSEASRCGNYLSIYPADIPQKGVRQGTHKHTHALLSLRPKAPHEEIVLPTLTTQGSSRQWGCRSLLCQGLIAKGGLALTLQMQDPLPPQTRYDQPITLDTWEPPPRVVKATSLLIHSPQLSIHFNHTQSSSLAPDIPLSFNTLLTSNQFQYFNNCTQHIMWMCNW